MELPKSPKGSLEVCGQTFKMIAASRAVCFLPALRSCLGAGLELAPGRERWAPAERGAARHMQRQRGEMRCADWGCRERCWSSG